MLLAFLFTILTTLSDGTFHTTYRTHTDAPLQACNAAVDTMIYYLQTDPNLLSERFFCSLGMQDDSEKNAFYLIWKESEYYPENQYSRLVLDVLVNEKPFLRDVVIESNVVDTMSGDRRDIRVDIHYAGTLIKQAYGTFHVMPTDDGRMQLEMDAHIKFGWFFRIFISRKVYSETVDWRLARFVENLRLTAEGQRPDDAYWENQSLNTNH